MGFSKDCETDLSKILVSPLGNLKETRVPACDVSCKKMSKQKKCVSDPYLIKLQDDVIVAKMDATVNELSHTRVRSFPTIRLYKKESKDVAEYNGERTLEGLTKFLKSDGVYGMAAPDEPEPAPHDEL